MEFQNPLTGRTMNMDDVTLFTSAARTATVNGAAFCNANKPCIRLDLVVSAASGTTPTLNITLETSKDGSSGWVAVPAVGTAFPQATGATSSRRIFAGCDRFVRGVATIGGTTPSFTFTLTGEAV